MSTNVPPEAEELLTSEPLAAFLATSRNDRPHVAPLWYLYEDGTVKFTANGRKLDDVRSNPHVSLAVQKADAGDPAWTVTLRGTARVIEDETENATARRLINRKYGAHGDAWAENTLVRVDVGSASYRTY